MNDSTRRGHLRDAIGDRGEKIAHLAITDFQTTTEPIFRAGFLGEKWPTFDFYVESTAAVEFRPYFFVQVRSTEKPIDGRLPVFASTQSIGRMKELPGPSYLFGVHTPSRRVFVKAIHAFAESEAVNGIALRNELLPGTLQLLHDEVRQFWERVENKPTTSVFV